MFPISSLVHLLLVQLQQKHHTPRNENNTGMYWWYLEKHELDVKLKEWLDQKKLMLACGIDATIDTCEKCELLKVASNNVSTEH